MSNFFIYENKSTDLPEEIQGNEKMKKVFSYNIINRDKCEYSEPQVADYFIVPVLFLLDEFNKNDWAENGMRLFCESLPYWKGNESRHVFLDQSDFCVKPSCITESIIFTVTPRRTDPTHRALPFYPYRHEALDINRLMAKSISETKFDIFFKGCDSSMPIRKEMLSLSDTFGKYGLTSYIKTYGRYFWNRDLTDVKKQEERKHYFERLTDSSFVLCPRGTGSTSSRFFETLYFGRIPILISSDVRLPALKDKRLEDYIIWVKEDQIEAIPSIVNQWKRKVNLEQVSNEIKEISHNYFVRDSVYKLIQETLS